MKRSSILDCNPKVRMWFTEVKKEFRIYNNFHPKTTKRLIYLHKKFFLRNPLDFHPSRTRNVFIYQKVVVKLPIDSLGFMANDWEGSISNTPESFNHPYYVQYPRTRLYYWKGIPILWMEKVEIADWTDKSYSDFPDWVGSVDCGQVGYTRKGRLVAYDYGS